jgi:hypothetical protein
VAKRWKKSIQDSYVEAGRIADYMSRGWAEIAKTLPKDDRRPFIDDVELTPAIATEGGVKRQEADTTVTPLAHKSGNLSPEGASKS